MANNTRPSATAEIRKITVEDSRLIEPFNDRARNLTILNKPLWLSQKESIEGVLGSRCKEEPEVASLADIHPTPEHMPLLVYRENLWFDEPFFRAFWEQAAGQTEPCQAAFSADDLAYTTYVLPLTSQIAPDKNNDGETIYRLPLWYFPNGVPKGGCGTANAHPIIVPSDHRTVGYYSVPEYMSTKLGDLSHLLPMRSVLSIESWVHIYYANVIFGIFAVGSRFEARANRDWLFRLRILAQAMLEQRQVLSCSQVVHMGKGVHIDPSVVIQGPAWIGDNVTIEGGAVITNSIIGANTAIGQDCHVFLSVIGEKCFLPFKASLFMSVMMQDSTVAQNTCLQMAVIGRNSFVGAGSTFTDYLVVPKPPGESLMAMGPNGLEPTGQVVMGSCVGHNCRIGSGMIVYPARMIESDVVLIATPDRRVIARNIAFEESDHHKLPLDRAKLQQRWWPRPDEIDIEEEEEW